MRDLEQMKKELRQYFNNVPLVMEAVKAIEELNADCENALNSVKNLINEADKRRWISVEERLPAKYDSVITADKHGNVRFNYLISEKYGTWSTGYHISHWMPLPEPPKEDE